MSDRIDVAFLDASDEGNHEPFRGQLIWGPGGAEVRFLDEDGMPAGSVYVEISDNKLVAYCWGPDDLDEPSHKIVVVENLKAAQARKDGDE